MIKLCIRYNFLIRTTVLLSFLGLSACGVQFQGTVDPLTSLSSGGSSASSTVDGVDSSAARIFATSTTWQGDLVTSGGDPDPHVAADNLCMATASTQGLTRDYRAIISVAGMSASTYLAGINAMPVYEIAGAIPTLVAATGADLWNADAVNLLQAIKYDESGALLAAGVSWTGTTGVGGVAATNCTNFSTSLVGVQGMVGRTNRVDSQWVAAVATLTHCGSFGRLICIGVVDSNDW